MAIDVTYTNGVIAAREKYLLKDKIFRFAEMTAEDAFRSLVESGYGNGAAGADLYSFEKLIEAEEEALDAFIREYAPSKTEQKYLLSPRDFHNAKALLKAAYLSTDAEKMLAPQGEIEISLLSSCVKNGDYSPLEAVNPALKKACEEATAIFSENTVSGAEIGELFEKAAYGYYAQIVKKNSTLKKILAKKVDMTNLLTAFRSGDEEKAKEKYLPGGKLTAKEISIVFSLDEEKAIKSFREEEYKALVEECFAAKRKGVPFTNAEKLRDGYETEYFSRIKYELKNSQPFLYYVYRRRIENANVRILFVCLLAGLTETEIKKRLRSV